MTRAGPGPARAPPFDDARLGGLPRTSQTPIPPQVPRTTTLLHAGHGVACPCTRLPGVPQQQQAAVAPLQQQAPAAQAAVQQQQQPVNNSLAAALATLSQSQLSSLAGLLGSGD